MINRLLIAAVLLYSGSSMAQVKVIISGGFSTAYRQLLPEFEKSTGIAVTTGSGASQGKGPTTIASQLERGEPYDVVIMSREGLQELIAAGRIVKDSDVDLATAAIGVAVRAGMPKPEVGTVEGLKRALLGADTIAVPQSTSGIFLLDKVFPRLGIDRARIKVTERGSQSAAAVANGEADIAVQPVSELMSVPGIQYVGVIADELQLIQMFSAAIVKDSKQVDAAKRLIQFLSSERAAAAIKRNGMEPARK
ncbi:MAG: molybdate transport system substrate-binding protein [Betaproteobacteria bacterium]|jgi:molybdate transport system substrate-binding protein|nr:molybdate transport system substrate-binding protein [Betaproteobacteria bacterium]